MQKKVEDFLTVNQLHCGEVTRYLDLVSEICEVGKELIKGSDYGSKPYQQTEALQEELGDCLFSLLALCCEANVNAEEALQAVLQKYEERITRKGDAGSGR